MKSRPGDHGLVLAPILWGPFLWVFHLKTNIEGPNQIVQMSLKAGIPPLCTYLLTRRCCRSTSALLWIKETTDISFCIYIYILVTGMLDWDRSRRTQVIRICDCSYFKFASRKDSTFEHMCSHGSHGFLITSWAMTKSLLIGAEANWFMEGHHEPQLL